MELDLVQLLLSLSDWLDWSHNGITDHQRRVAFASLNMGQALGLDGSQLTRLFRAAVIHDIGAVTWAEKDSLRQFDVVNTLPHCARGRSLVLSSCLLSDLAPIILHHHDRWIGANPEGVEGDDIPLLSRIIHVCDRVAIQIREDDHVLNQRRRILDHMKSESGRIFDPKLVDLLIKIGERPSFWLDMVQRTANAGLYSLIPPDASIRRPFDVRQLGEVIAFSVDAKSRFTYRHSHGVAAITRYLADRFGFDEGEASLLESAGLLHDLGKLTVPEEILEKPGPLTSSELAWIRQHTYYTYWFMVQAGLPMEMAEWSAYHHERLDGRGYPFGKTARDMKLEHRIVAVADIFTAIKENRPYRPGMDWDGIEKVLTSQVRSNAIDGDVAAAILDDRSAVDELWDALSIRLDPLARLR